MAQAEHQRAKRQQLLRLIEAEAGDLTRWAGRNAIDARVLAALARVEREEFVPARARQDAYLNAPLPIGHGQTISQPFVVALMTDLLQLDPSDVVLEIGTGSGYQTAILAELAAHVYTVEVIDDLAGTARERLDRLGYRNVETRRADGYQGWPEHAPFDAVIVTAAAREVPSLLVKQLKDGGRMVIPVGGAGGQDLMFLEKDPSGRVRTRGIVPVAFVPLVCGADA